MIFNLLKNLLIALLLDAGAALAFDIESAEPAVATVPQSCALPVIATDSSSTAPINTPDPDTQS